MSGDNPKFRAEKQAKYEAKRAEIKAARDAEAAKAQQDWERFVAKYPTEAEQEAAIKRDACKKIIAVAIEQFGIDMVADCIANTLACSLDESGAS